MIDLRSNADLITCLFEVSAGLILISNIWRTYKDKGTKGVSLSHPVFFSAMASWNIYFYTVVQQPLAFGGAIFVTVTNTIWLLQFLYYNIYKKRSLMN